MATLALTNNHLRYAGKRLWGGTFNIFLDRLERIHLESCRMFLQEYREDMWLWWFFHEDRWCWWFLSWRSVAPVAEAQQTTIEAAARAKAM